MRVLPAILSLLIVGVSCGSTHPLSGAWEGACVLDPPSPINGEARWEVRLVVEENDWGGNNSSTTGWGFYTGTYLVTSGDRSWEGQGMQFSHCNLKAGCGDINSPLYPTTAEGQVNWAVVTNDEVAGYPNVDFRFSGVLDGRSMSGDCQQVFEPWNSGNAPAFDVWGPGSAEQVSSSEEPW